MLSLYVDSAARDDVEPLLDVGIFRGITTNPTILDRAGLSGRDIPEVYRWAVAAGAQEVFVQTWGDSADELEKRGRELAELGDKVVIKVAATRSGTRAASRLAAEGIPVLITVVYSAMQAVSAACAGATYLAPYVGRMADAGRDARIETVAMVELLRASESATRVLAASVRSTADLVYLTRHGVDAFALPPAVANALFDERLTEESAATFDAISARW
ncbi:MAG: transaldolase family protein [Mycobacterium sp.]